MSKLEAQCTFFVHAPVVSPSPAHQMFVVGAYFGKVFSVAGALARTLHTTLRHPTGA
jgi:hypothetical protein